MIAAKNPFTMTNASLSSQSHLCLLIPLNSCSKRILTEEFVEFLEEALDVDDETGKEINSSVNAFDRFGTEFMDSDPKEASPRDSSSGTSSPSDSKNGARALYWRQS